MKLFLLSGLGADSRVFDFLDLPGIELKPVEWLMPLPKERIADYAGRLSEALKPYEPVNLLGVSFGGIIAQEMATHLDTRKVFIISSIKSSAEVGLAFHITKRLGILRLISPKKMKQSMMKMGPWLFGLEKGSEVKLFRNITTDTNEEFLKWAVCQLHGWKTSSSNLDVIHIHGIKDKMFPINKIKNFIPIEDGGHFMIVNRAEEISKIILEKIK
jgi:pimeloyl-ACP methyl ester carboxylesterase